MIELILFVALGFLMAALLGLVIAPAIYRRVVKLTERRMRATVPLNAAEIKAAKDMDRAVFAAENARISVELKKEREILTQEKAGSSRLSDTIIKMRSQNQELQANVDSLKEDAGKLRSNLRSEENKLEQSRQSLKDAQKANLEKEEQILALIDKANRLSTEVGSQKIDLASKDTESENLRSTIDALRNEHTKLRNNQSELENRALKIEKELEQEKSRAEGLNKRLTSATAKLADRDQTIENKSNEIKRLKERVNSVRSETSDLKKTLKSSETERRSLERQLNKVEKQLSKFTGKPAPVRKPSDTASKVAKLIKKAPVVEELNAHEEDVPAETIANKVERLRTRHNDLVDQLKKESAPSDDPELRRELAEIAAMMIDLTAAREGKSSPIHEILAEHTPIKPKRGLKIKPSLADRAIRRVDKTTSSTPAS
ncbi:MAG: hypothetical protein ABJE63_12020 [Lentilitoribacter sp.]